MGKNQNGNERLHGGARRALGSHASDTGTAEGRSQAWHEHARLKETRAPGVVDWGASRRPGCRYEAYWRAMSSGLFSSAEEAWAFLQGLG